MAKKQTAVESKGLSVLQKLTANIEKKYGKGIVGMAGTMDLSVPKLSSNIMSLDFALGGGFPKGRYIEMYGESSAGKTSLALHTIAQSQKEGGMCGFIDAEHSFSPEHAANLGVDVNNLFYAKPERGEEAFDILHQMVETNAFSVIVVDSISAITPTKMLESEMGDNIVGLQARLVQQGVVKLNSMLFNTQTIVIFINQMRSAIQTMQWGGDTTTTTGGKALVFYASQRLEVRKSTAIKNSDNIPVGYLMKVTVKKNKVGVPLRVGEVNYYFDKCFSAEDEIFDMALKYQIIEKSGSWFRYDNTNIGQGRERALAALQDNPELMEIITNKVKEEHEAFISKTPKPSEEEIGEIDIEVFDKGLTEVKTKETE